MCDSVHGADDWCWRVSFAFWVCGNGFARLGRDLHVWMHPFQATQHPADGLVLGRFGKNALDGNDALWSVPLSMELMVAASMLHLSCGCMSMDCQAWGVSCMPGCILFKPYSTQQIGWFRADLIKTHWTEMTHYGVCLFPYS